MVGLGEERDEEALLAELLDETVDDELGDFARLELEDDFAAAVGVGLRVAHALRLRVEEPDERRRRDDRRDERHQDADAEHLLGEVAVGKADARDDERDFATRNHARADAQGAKEVEAAEERRDRAAYDLCEDGERGVDAAEDQDRLRAERRNVDHHAHHAEEDRHEERVEVREILLDEVLYVGAREREAHHVRADDEREAERLEHAGDNERKAERERGDRAVRLEELEEPGNLLREHHADDCADEPHAERLQGRRADGAPVDALRRSFACCRRLTLGTDDAHADREDDNAENVVDHCARHDRHALLGVHLLLLREDARRDADGGRGGHDAHEHRRRRKRRLDDLALLHELAELREAFDAAEKVGEVCRRVDGAEVAEEEREHHAAYAHERAGERVLEEHLEIRLETGEEQQDDRRYGADAVELGRRGEGIPARGGLGAQGLAIEDAVLEHAVEAGNREAAKGPRANQNAGPKFAKDARKLERRRDRPADLRGEDDYADLQDEEEHLRRHAEFCRPVGRLCRKRLARERTSRKEYASNDQPRLLHDFNLFNSSTFSKMLHPRRPVCGLLWRHLGESHHDEPVAYLALVCRRAVEAADMAAALPCYGIGLKAIAVLDVGDKNLLVGDDPDRLHVVWVERKRALVIEARLGYSYPVQLRL